MPWTMQPRRGSVLRRSRSRRLFSVEEEEVPGTTPGA
jgi:hypothetical protein